MTDPVKKQNSFQTIPLDHFFPMLQFYTSWKLRKIKGLKKGNNQKKWVI